MSGISKNSGQRSTPVYLTEPIASDIEIGAVEIKDGSTDQRATVNASGQLLVSTTITKGATSTETSVAANVASVTLKAANTSRIKLVIYNDDTAGTGASIYVKEGGTATSSSYTYKLAPTDTVIIDDYSGVVDAIWTAATGNARITETV